MFYCIYIDFILFDHYTNKTVRFFPTHCQAQLSKILFLDLYCFCTKLFKYNIHKMLTTSEARFTAKLYVTNLTNHITTLDSCLSMPVAWKTGTYNLK